VQKILQGKAVGPWLLHSGLIYFKNWVYIKPDSTLVPAIIAEFHNNMHEVYQKGLQRIRSVFYRLGTQKQIKNFIKHCDTCQRHKVDNTKPTGPLQPLPIPTQIWSDISMDFIDGLPNSFGKTTIFVVVDRFSKYGHFTAIKHPYTAPQVAQTFFE
jgi:hypothetical protein